MTKKTIAILGLLGVLLVASFGTVAAQAGDEPAITPTAAVTEVPVVTEVPETVDGTGTDTGTKFFTHPVVQLLSAYFDRDWQPVEETNFTPLATPDPLATPEPGDTGGEVGLGPIGEQIAAYHEDGVGFGVLVKLFAMAEAAQAACLAGDGTAVPADPSAEACVPVSAEELVATFKSGAGLGQLYKEYGKPEKVKPDNGKGPKK